MKKESVIAGAIFGFFMGIFYYSSIGLVVSLVIGMMSGVIFGVAIYLFANSPIIKRQISLDNDDLLPNENIIFSKPANLIIKPKEFGLQKFAFEDLLWAVGMKDKESLGGYLHLTNLRILFKSHKFNRIRGKTSIFLPSIQKLENSSFLLFSKLTVYTVSAKVEFAMSDIDNLIKEISNAQNMITQELIEKIANYIKIYPQKVSDGLESWDSINTVNNLINLGKKTSNVAELVTNPIGALSTIFMNEIIDKSIAEKWQKAFEAKGHNNGIKSDS